MKIKITKNRHSDNYKQDEDIQDDPGGIFKEGDHWAFNRLGVF